jgi:membrane protease subunit (stomatin/prohibitin family)
MSQFMEVIEWLDDTGDGIVQRVPPEGSGETKLGAQLVVRDSQAAIFFKNGRGLDVFGPGRHTLTSLNLPILTKLLSLPWGFTSPFRAEVYFVNQKVFTNLRWGTRDPVVFRDRELGLVRLRAFGVFTMRVTEPLLFVNSLVGTQGSYGTAEIQDYLREVIVSRLNDYLGESLESLLDLPKQYDEMGVAVRGRLHEDFRKYGIELIDLLVSRITPPEDVQRMIDGRSGMSAVGNLDDYLKLQAANALGGLGGGGPGGGTGGAGGCDPGGSALGLGMGAGLGLILPGMLLHSRTGEPLATPDMLARGLTRCPECHGEVATTGRFCSHCGHQMVTVRKCFRCDKNLTAQARFCPACGLDLSSELRCGQCTTVLPPGTRFCFHCGERVTGTSVPPQAGPTTPSAPATP